MPKPIALYTKTWRSSGAGLFAQELVIGMVDAGAKVIFIAPGLQDARLDAPRPGLIRIRTRNEQTGGSRLSRALVSLQRIGGSALGLLRARRQTRIFLVTIPDPLLFALPLLLLLRLTGARIIYIVHDPLPHSWKLPARLRRIENGTFAATYALSRHLVVLSLSAKAALAAAYGEPASRISVIEHGVFSLGAPTPPPGTGELLLFGTLRRNKGIREAIEGVIAARARGADVHLLIAGAPDPAEAGYWQSCEGLARAHPDAIKLEIGYVSDDRLRLLVDRCDAFLLPYRDFHSQSGVAMTAASNARAVISSRAGGIGDLIDDGMAAVIIRDPVSGEDVADAVCAFAGTAIAAWGERALAFHARTMESRSWASIGRQYVALAQQVDSA